MALNRAQLVMGNSSQGVVLPGQVQGVTQGTGVSIAANGAISFDSTSATGVLKTNNPTAYNTYVWPTTIGAAGQQLQLGAGGALSWEDPGGIPWTAKGQLVVGTGLATSTLLNVGSNGSILIADSTTTSGLNYTANYVATTGPTSAANLPAGNAGARPLTPPAGAFRYNSTSTNLEFYNGVSWEIVASSISNEFVEKTSDTGIALIPAGTSAQRPVASTYAGGFRFNSDLDTIEFSDGVAWKQLVMLNNLAGYNAYVWPNADGAYGSFLQTDAAGNLSWKNPAFVGTTAPTPASDGMLWYDCNVGYLKVYQSCVAPNGWTKVAEPGLPILTTNMSASPAFSSGSGSSASPYVVTTSTVAPGDSVLIPNTVTVTGLAPNQYVSIVDQNAVTNGGRYHFTNNFADSAGTLVFNIIFTDAPDSAGGTNYTALIRVGYATGYIRSDVSVVTPVISLTISNPGSISGATNVGSTLSYTTGTATGGTSPYTFAWVWKKASDDSVLQTNGATYVIPASLIGDRVYVTLTATDSVSATASGDTADYPAAPATITAAPVALSISNPGTISGTAQAGSTLTYTTGSATGGTSPYTYAWVWKKASDNSTLQTNGATYLIPASLVGDRVYVTLTATDSVSATASGSTPNYPAAPATITAAPTALSISSAGTISGTAFAGSTLSYTTGTATGGTSPYTYAWVWKKASDDSVLQTNGATYLIPASLVGDRVYVTLTATDSVSATASGATADYPAPPATIAAAPVVLTISNPGSISGTASAGSTLTYTTGSATGGTSPYTYAWVWKKASDNSTLQTNGSTYLIPGSLIGDRVYVTLTATDSVSATASGNTTNYPASPAVIISSTFPNWAVAAPTTIPGITSGSWSDGTTSITSTNCIQISLDGTNFNQGPLSVSNGTTLYMQWEQTGASCGGAPSGTTITGTITNGTFTNSYSLTLDRNPDNFTFSDLTGQALSTAITSNIITISGTNSPAYITGTSATLTSVQVSVAGGAFVSLPTSGTTVTVNPGATVQIKGTTGASNGTGYSVTVNMGTTSDTWTVTTTAVTPTVAQPSITSPVSGSTGLNPGLNCTPGVTLVASAFSSSSGAGTDHASSDWQVATDSGFTTIVFSATADTVNKTSILVPIANLAGSTTYYCRVRYTSGTAGGGVVTTSAYSSSAYNWITTSSFIPPIGTAMCGGYFGGQVTSGGILRNLIVSPKATGGTFKQVPDGPGSNPATASTTNMSYGLTNTNAMNNATNPWAQWARSLTIGGYTDWYIYSVQEAVVLYWNLKPYDLGVTNNTVISSFPTIGEVPASVTPGGRPPYTIPVPAQTSLPDWQATTGSQYLSMTSTSTITDGTSTGYVGDMYTGFENNYAGTTYYIDSFRGGLNGGSNPPGGVSVQNVEYRAIRSFPAA